MLDLLGELSIYLFVLDSFIALEKVWIQELKQFMGIKNERKDIGNT